MLKKEDCLLLDLLKETSFEKVYAINIKSKIISRTKYFELRAISKTQIINQGETIALLKEKAIRGIILHPFICRYLCTFKDYNHVFIMSDLPRGGFLYYYLRKYKRFSVHLSRFLIAEIILAIQYLHKKGIVYKLLSPENILLSEDGHVKLRFDYCNAIGLTESDYEKNIVYVPIDYLRMGKLSFESDYWSIGIILYEFLTGRTPFQGESANTTRNNILKKKVIYPSDMDESAVEMLNILLEKYHFRRLGVMQQDASILRRLDFFRYIDWEKLENKQFISPMKLGELIVFNKNKQSMLDVFEVKLDKNADDGFGNIFKSFGRINGDVNKNPYI